MRCRVTDSQGDPVLIYTEKVLLVKTFRVDPDDPETTASFKVTPNAALFFVTGNMLLITETLEEYARLEDWGDLPDSV